MFLGLVYLRHFIEEVTDGCTEHATGKCAFM